MLARNDDGRLTIRSVDGSRSHVVDLGPYRSISSLSLDPAAGRVAFTAVSGAGRDPDVGSNTRGDLRLFVADLASGHAQSLTKGYAHDAVWFPDATRIAFHNSRGVTVVDAVTGRELDSYAMGRFSWGPPSVSVSPAGTHIAAIKWKGDERKIVTRDLASRELRVHRPSCFEYSWRSDSQIVYTGGQSIHVLDVSTGKASRWPAKASMTSASAQLRALLSLGASENGEHLSGVVAYTGRVYFLLMVAAEERRCSALVSLSYDGSELLVHAWTDGARRFRAFALVNEARTFAIDYEDTNRFHSVISRGTLFVGEHADTIPSGFVPLPQFAMPQFGFHTLPGDPASRQVGDPE